ncbi:TRAP transporter small permease [Ramlibacter tataouinensis]|uniref:TRAP transporter small permease protein n=1 Tax=Ramlibacter tataouinensis (strain ATCC BAA-407 / DSM 14655 / LMG 21543 / TTB310) TaxID=365046 RepID=F5XY37_RAMTT|nr:TRAP transporter small permease [Ramlibacter tataouinensis]AEG94362.1 Candidate small permease component [Ramlibacter tataouinensis TTB310]
MARAYGRLLAALALAGCALLFAMMLVIVADVALRNIPVPGLPRGLAWSNEVSELMLYLLTLLVAPWLLRQGQHIRVDILLQALPPRLAWTLEWVGDALGLACCLFMAWYGARAAWESWASGSLSIKTLVTPEWWSLAPLPVVFLLLAGEMLFRMARLYAGERGPRRDAVSAA